MNDALARRLSLSAALLALLWSAAAVAQGQPTITVRIEDNVGFSDDELFELQYGLEQIVTDYGELALVPAYDLETLLTTSDLRDLDACGTEPHCLATFLTPVDIDNALVVVTTRGDDGYDARILAVDLQRGRVAGEQEGFFPQPGDSLFLLAPAFEAMAGLQGDSGSAGEGERVADRGEGEREGDRGSEPVIPVGPESEVNVLSTSLIAGGGVVVAIGLAFWIMADDTQEEIQAAPHDTAALADLQDTGEGQATLGNIFVIGGTLILATGVVFELLGVGEPSDGFDDFDDDEDEWSLRLGAPGGDPYVGIEVSFP